MKLRYCEKKEILISLDEFYCDAAYHDDKEGELFCELLEDSECDPEYCPLISGYREVEIDDDEWQFLVTTDMEIIK